MKTTRRASPKARQKPVTRIPGAIIGVVLPQAVLDRVDQQAELEGRSRSNMASRLIERALRIDEGADSLAD